MLVSMLLSRFFISVEFLLRAISLLPRFRVMPSPSAIKGARLLIHLLIMIRFISIYNYSYIVITRQLELSLDITPKHTPSSMCLPSTRHHPNLIDTAYIVTHTANICLGYYHQPWFH